MSACLRAVQHIRSTRGGSQSHLLWASDGNYYVVKFQNNPQHVRVLANEMLATRFAQWLGLPVPPVDVIEVSDWLICQHAGNARAGGWKFRTLQQRPAACVAVFILFRRSGL